MICLVPKPTSRPASGVLGTIRAMPLTQSITYCGCSIIYTMSPLSLSNVSDWHQDKAHVGSESPLELQKITWHKVKWLFFVCFFIGIIIGVHFFSYQLHFSMISNSQWTHTFSSSQFFIIPWSSSNQPQCQGTGGGFLIHLQQDLLLMISDLSQWGLVSKYHSYVYHLVHRMQIFFSKQISWLNYI